MNLTAVLITGLLAGGVSCAAVQGGLLTGLITRRRTRKHNETQRVASDTKGGLMSRLNILKLAGLAFGPRTHEGAPARSIPAELQLRRIAHDRPSRRAAPTTQANVS